MSDVTIIRPRQRAGASLIQTEEGGAFTFDAILRSSIQDSGELSEYPVESGADRADHYRLRPVEASLSAVLTNTPLHESAFAGREIRLYEALVELQRAGEPLTLTTATRTLFNMVIISVRHARQSASQALSVEVELRQLLIATTQTVEIPSPVKRRGGGGRRNAGNQAARATAASEAAIINTSTESAVEQEKANKSYGVALGNATAGSESAAGNQGGG